MKGKKKNADGSKNGVIPANGCNNNSTAKKSGSILKSNSRYDSNSSSKKKKKEKKKSKKKKNGSISNSSSSGSNGNVVTFGTVSVREHEMTMGVNPATSIGTPVCLGWEYTDRIPATMTLEEYETSTRYGKLNVASGGKKQKNGKNRSPTACYMNYYRRKAILDRAGFTEQQISSRKRQVSNDRLKRRISQHYSFPILYAKSWRTSIARRKTKKFVKKYRKEHKKQQKSTTKTP